MQLLPGLFALAFGVLPPLPLDPRGDPVRTEKLPADVRVEHGTSRAWILAAAAVPAERGKFSHELLAGADSNARNVETYREYLKKRWEVERRVDLIARLDTIGRKDPRHALGDIMDSFRKSKLPEEDIKQFFKDGEREQWLLLLRSSKRMAAFKQGFLAHELITSVVLIRQGYGAGYIEEPEAWRRLEVIAKKLQKAYASFEEVGEVWCIGLEVLNDPEAASSREAFERLAREETSPWKRTPWDLKLTKFDALPTKPGAPKSGSK